MTGTNSGDCVLVQTVVPEVSLFLIANIKLVRLVEDLAQDNEKIPFFDVM